MNASVPTRVSVREWNLNDPIEGLGRFDVIVSGFAIHHLEDERKQALFREIATRLTPGGMFANLEVVQSATPELHSMFRTAIGRSEDDPGDLLVDAGDPARLDAYRRPGAGRLHLALAWVRAPRGKAQHSLAEGETPIWDE